MYPAATLPVFPRSCSLSSSKKVTVVSVAVPNLIAEVISYLFIFPEDTDIIISVAGAVFPVVVNGVRLVISQVFFGSSVDPVGPSLSSGDIISLWHLSP